MSVFAYNPSSFSSWTNSIVNYLNGDSDSISACSKKFSAQIETLVQPGVWTGPAAAQNYQNFLDTHQALINFVNSFGSTFETAMNEISKAVDNLETNNLGATSVAAGNVSYAQLAALSQENINVEVVRYDYATISGISNELNTILTTLEDVTNNLKMKINELNNGSSIWDGDAAEAQREALINVVETNMNTVTERLNTCIQNISGAAQNAQAADSAK